MSLRGRFFELVWWVQMFHSADSVQGCSVCLGLFGV